MTRDEAHELVSEFITADDERDDIIELLVENGCAMAMAESVAREIRG